MSIGMQPAPMSPREHKSPGTPHWLTDLRREQFRISVGTPVRLSSGAVGVVAGAASRGDLIVHLAPETWVRVRRRQLTEIDGRSRRAA